MPSNEIYIEQINGLAAKLEKTVETEDLNNAQLGQMVKDLRAEVKERIDDAAAVAAAAEKDAGKVAEAEAPKEALGLRVAPGKAITSKRGIVSDGEPVSPDIFEGGQGTVESLVKRGFLVR